MSATFRWNWRGALWTTLALSALQLIFLALQRPVTIAQFIVEWNFLLMIGGVFVFFGVSRERSAEHLAFRLRLGPILDCSRTRISTGSMPVSSTSPPYWTRLAFLFCGRLRKSRIGFRLCWRTEAASMTAYPIARLTNLCLQNLKAWRSLPKMQNRANA